MDGRVVAVGVALYLWAGVSTYLAMRVMCIEAEGWVGRKLPPDEPDPATLFVLFLCVWWLSPFVLAYAVCNRDHPTPMERMSRRIYQDWLAVQLSDDAAKRGRERAAAEAAHAADEYENEHD